jgi:ribosomal protein S18 acetylase RimI-like enzyme
MIAIVPFEKHFLPAAGELFTHDFARLRQAIPLLPAHFGQSGVVSDRLEKLLARRPGLAALEDGRLVGYLGWMLIDAFRETQRRAAYCPEWAHAAAGSRRPAVYRALYRAAAAQWAADGCQVHAISLLAGDSEAEKTWFWNGFGLTVVDALRPLTSLGAPAPTGLEVRKAAPADAQRLSVIEIEHRRHYTQPPVLMAAPAPTRADEFVELLRDERNSVWLALDGSETAGFMRFESSSFGAADIVNDAGTVAITGAYVRPAYRGRTAAAALLDSALSDYAARGFARCSVDFESFNPEAAAFWMKYFEPVCLSLTRTPES